MIYLPILGALALATFSIVERTILKKRKIGIKTFLTASFLAVTLVMLPFIYFFFELNQQAFQSINILIFGIVIIFAILGNHFYLYSTKWEKISNIEPARMLESLFVILFAIVFSFIFGEALFERNPKVIISALIAGAALVFSHIKKHHLEFNKYFLAAILGSLFFSLELVTTRLILDYYTPFTFYFLRCSIIFLISFLIMKPKFSELNNKVRYEIVGIATLWVLYRVIVYYGYLNLGVIFTTLVIMLGPVLIYIFAWKFLKEKISWRNIIAAAIIVGAILYSILG
tara:strand:+ start:226 stop:1080 length:855 start_codon:yes stop_codon:yes gene_type:complete